MQENREQGTETFVIEGRNAVLEAFRSGRTIDKIYVLDGCQDGPVRTIVREAKKHGSLLLQSFSLFLLPDAQRSMLQCQNQESHLLYQQ